MKGLNKRFAFAIILAVLTVATVSYVLLRHPTNTPTGTLKVASITSISVCQAGYDKSDPKIALILLNTSETLENTSFHIIKVETNETVFTSSLTYLGVYWSLSRWKSDAVYLANFTDLSTEGTFKLETNEQYSHPFKIRTNNWFYWLDEMIAFYRFQRCGENTTKFIGYCDDATPSSTVPHGPCHMDDAWWNNSGTLVHFDGTGGWHDAGDNNKYGANTAFADAMLYLTYIRLESASHLDADQNKIPDILEEAKWGSDHLIRQINFTGGPVFDVIELHANPYPWNYPTNESGRCGETRDDNYQGNPFKTEQAYKTAGCLALAHRAWKPLNEKYAEQCLISAEKAWNWSQENPNNGGGSYSGEMEHNKVFAAVELYLATGDKTYYDVASSMINQSSWWTPRTWWGDMASLALTEFYPNTTGSLKTKIYNSLKNVADGILNAWKENPYYIRRQTIGNWGSNGQLANNLGDVLRFYELSGDTTYLKAAERAIGWFFGVNPWNISFVSGIGAHHTLYLHSRLDNDPMGNSSIIIPGALVDGPLNNPSYGYSPAPWYKDQSRGQDPRQYMYNEHAIDMPTDLIYAIVSFSYSTEGLEASQNQNVYWRG
jgi:endoglucanase